MKNGRIAAGWLIATGLTLSLATRTFAQVTPAAGYTPPDDTPTVKVGGVIFADYTYIESPQSKDAAGNSIHPSAFNIARTYINVTGNINHRIAFRVTPDISRETGTGSSLNGSLTFRLKYAYGQYNLDDFTNKGSWLRFGLQQTPWVDYGENVYRYRFQGTIFADREGYLTSSDYAASGHWVLPSGYGDIHGGIYNGEGYNRVDPNDQKALQVRATVRPVPLGGVWKGLRLTAFVDRDNFVKNGPKRRTILNATFEHDLFNAGAEYLKTTDQTLPTAASVEGKGYSVWATPKLPNNFELLLRHDDLKPVNGTSQKRKRNIFGVAYWMPARSGVTTAILLDYDSLKQSGFTPARPDDTRYGIKLLVNF